MSKTPLKLTIVSVCTDASVGYDNFMASLKYHRYENVVILGMREKWLGWSWRSQKYLAYFNKELKSADYNKHNIYCCVDATDLFFVSGPDTLIESYQSYYHEKSANGNKQNSKKAGPIISAERNQSLAGLDIKKFFSVLNPTQGYTQERSQECSEYQYPNAGCIIGTARQLKRLYSKIALEENDQHAIIRKRMSGELNYQLDYFCQIAATVPFCSNGKFNDFQLFYVDKATKQLRSKLYPDSRPALMHFPGTIPYHYNSFLKEIYSKENNFSKKGYRETFIKIENYLRKIPPIILILIIAIITLLLLLLFFKAKQIFRLGNKK